MVFTDIFKKFLENLPQGILDDEKRMAEKFQDGAEMVNFAKTAYAPVYAYMKIFDSCCRVKEEMGIHKFIKDEGARARFDKFLREGGDIEKIRAGKVEEDYLSPGDMAVFREAEAEVHKQVHRETREHIAGARKAEFDGCKKEGEEKMRATEEKIGLLRKMADESPEWREEILDKVGELEERWANPGNEPQTIDAEELLEYYGSIINSEQ